MIINDALLLETHLSKLTAEQKDEDAKKIVVNILPATTIGMHQPCDDGRGDFHCMHSYH